MNVHLRAMRILLIVYAHHMTSESRDVCIYARVVHFNSSHLVTFPIHLSLVFLHAYMTHQSCMFWHATVRMLTTIVNLLLTFQLKSHASRYFLASGTIQLSNLCPSTSHVPGNYFCSTLRLCDFPMVHWEHIYLHTFKIPGP